MEIRAPDIMREDILFLDDQGFCDRNACIVTGCSGGIGRTVAVAAAANGLHVVALDVDTLQLQTPAWNRRTRAAVSWGKRAGISCPASSRQNHVAQGSRKAR